MLLKLYTFDIQKERKIFLFTLRFNSPTHTHGLSLCLSNTPALAHNAQIRRWCFAPCLAMASSCSVSQHTAGGEPPPLLLHRSSLFRQTVLMPPSTGLTAVEAFVRLPAWREARRCTHPDWYAHTDAVKAQMNENLIRNTHRGQHV